MMEKRCKQCRFVFFCQKPWDDCRRILTAFVQSSIGFSHVLLDSETIHQIYRSSWQGTWTVDENHVNMLGTVADISRRALYIQIFKMP